MSVLSLLIFLSLSFCGLQARSTKPQSNKKYEPNTTQPEQLTPSKRDPRVISANDTTAEIKSDHREQRYDPRSDTLYRVYLWATTLGVFGGILGIFILIKQTIATKRAADAAKASADALVRIERAWIFLDISLDGRLSSTRIGGAEQTAGRFSFRCRNVGKSPAWITEKILHFEIYNSDGPPKRPDIDAKGRFQYGPEPMEVGADKTDARSWQTDGTPGFGNFTLVMGAIKYHDIFGDHVTVCGYMLSPDQRNLERIFGLDYNQYT